jgi:4,5-dihydroxyphthalate decarboxylase
MLLDGKKAAGLPKAGTIDFVPFGLEAVKPALDLMSTYALELGVTPRRVSFEEMFDDTTRALQA